MNLKSLARPDRILRRWLKDGSFRTIVRNASYLGSSDIVGALLTLLALALAGRGMTPALFGTLVVIESYAKGVSDLAKFQTWQLVVQFGAPALTRKDLARFRDVTNFSFGLDIASSAVALVSGAALLPLLGHAIGLSSDDFWWALAYCSLIPIRTAATPTGILRAIDRFDLIAIQGAITPLLMALGAGIAYFGDLGFPGFLAAWYVARVAGGLLLWLFAVQELRRNGIRGALRPSLLRSPRRIPDAWNFVWTTNIAHSIWAASTSGTDVLVGILLGPAAAGLFKIATTFYGAAGAPSGFLGKSFYPEIMRLDPRTKQPWKLGLRTAALVGGFGCVLGIALLLAGGPLIGAVFGAKYEEAYNLLQIMSGALVISMMSFPLESLLYMVRRQRMVLLMRALGVGAYLLLLVAFGHYFGLTGVAVAFLLGQCLQALFFLLPTLASYRGRATLAYPPRAGDPS